MGKIIIEFGTPNAREKARAWKKQLVEVIEKAIKGIQYEADKPVFGDDEFSVYFTFDDTGRVRE